VFENPRTGARIEVLRREPDLLELERLYTPNTGKADRHKHLDFDQWFEVVEGEMTVTVAGEERAAGPGETVHVERGMLHVDPWNAGEADLRVRARFQPLAEFVEAYTEALGRRMRADDGLNDQGEFSELQLFVLLHGYRAQTFGPGPVWLQKPVVPLLAALGRTRGYRVQAHGD
jgi:hypothetical protein